MAARVSLQHMIDDTVSVVKLHFRQDCLLVNAQMLMNVFGNTRAIDFPSRTD